MNEKIPQEHKDFLYNILAKMAIENWKEKKKEKISIKNGKF